MPNPSRIHDTTTTGAIITGPGVSHVQIAGQPAAVQGDRIQGATFDGAIATGSSRILIGGRPAAYVGCIAAGVNPQTGTPATTLISTGTSTVDYINP